MMNRTKTVMMNRAKKRNCDDDQNKNCDDEQNKGVPISPRSNATAEYSVTLLHNLRSQKNEINQISIFKVSTIVF